MLLTVFEEALAIFPTADVILPGGEEKTLLGRNSGDVCDSEGEKRKDCSQTELHVEEREGGITLEKTRRTRRGRGVK